MASTHFTDTVTEIPADWANDVNALTYDVFGGAHTVAQAVAALGLSWVVQTNLHANMTGGTIDGTPIGQTTPAAGTFTVLKATTQGTGANDVALVPFVTSAVAALQATLGSLSLQNANAIAVTGGTINATSIGLSTPAAAAFTAASVAAAPVNATDVANKQYVDGKIAGLPSFGTMALQNANAITVTGGTIDNVVIGGTTPAEGFFLTVVGRHVTGTSGTLWLDNALNGYFNYGAVLQANTDTPNAGVVLGASGAFTVNSSVGTALLTLDPSGRLVLGGAINDSIHTLQLAGGAVIDSILLSTAITLPNQATTKLYVDTGLANVVANVGGQIATAIGQLGSMAHQNANAVAITGGTIDGATIGSVTPAAATFTTVTTQTVGNASGAILFNQTSGGQGVVLNASSPTKPNIAAWINTGGAFKVMNGTATIAQINSAGRSQFGIGATDDGTSVLLVLGQASVSGQLLIPQAPSVGSSAANKAYVDEQIATVQGSTVTPTWVQQQIAAAVADLASTTYVDNAVAGLVNAAYVSSAITNALTNYATQTYVQNQITAALATYATQSYVNSQITSSLASYATQSYVTSQLASYATQSYVTSQLASYATIASLTASNGASLIGYGSSTVKATLDSLTASSGSTQAANTVFAGPTSGIAQAPTFRALVTADLPQAIAATTITTSTLSATTSITAPTASFTGTGAIQLPSGNTAARPTPTPGMLRYNSQTAQIEFYTSTQWATYLGTGGGTITGPLTVSTETVTGSLLVNTTGGNPLAARIGSPLAVGVGGSTGDAHLTIDAYSSSSSVGTNVSFTGRAIRGTTTTPAALAVGDWLSGVDGYGFGATALAGAPTGAVAIVAEEAFTDTSMKTAIVFQVTPTGSVTMAEAARFSGTGHLLVGTTTDNGTDLIQVNGLISGTGVVPRVASGNDLGTATRQWRNIYLHGFEANTASVQVVPNSGDTITVTATTNLLMVDPAATIAALTIALPSFGVAADGQYMEISFSQNVTALTWSLSSGTMQNGAPASITAGQAVRLRYNLAINQWRLV